jgi:hypothetical protein
MRKTKIKQRKFTVVLREEEEGGYSIRCLEFPIPSVREKPNKKP